MVNIEVVSSTEHEESPSVARRLDAEAIEAAAETMDRVSAKMHLQALAKKLRKESDALARLEQSQEKKSTATTNASQDEKVTAPAPAVATPMTTPAPAVSSTNKKHYTPIDKFAFDEGGYKGPFVTLYIDLPDVGSIPREQITCDFTKDSFDLIVRDLQGQSYRLFKDSLEKDIQPDKSKIVVKAHKILVKLAKIKAEYGGGYDMWTKLTDTKGKKQKSGKASSDPQSSIMDLMRDMYESGDDQMKKMIGETMMKQQRGELGRDNNMMPGGGLDGLEDDM